ncbi:hypothetical protein PYW08_005693 [Mythimna loreyi]|uniref:Uncharacterized protein n=1 Tax=Mythimna loreyi TaxID=667449 RepID=A0ACC2QJA6_9NEOP|nr:hypothetical protein PYW08_005693 [Mythimna loreyi]
MHMHVIQIRVMLRLCGCSYILFTIFATSTMIAVTAKGYNIDYDYVEGKNDLALRKPKVQNMPTRPKALTKKTPGGKHGISLASGTAPLRRNRCCPYNFDSRICKIVDDRVLCGYNTNSGKPQSQDRAVELHGGCRLRRGRLECGYQHGPFTNPRRPPAWNVVRPKDTEKAQPIG